MKPTSVIYRIFGALIGVITGVIAGAIVAIPISKLTDQQALGVAMIFGGTTGGLLGAFFPRQVKVLFDLLTLMP